MRQPATLIRICILTIMYLIANAVVAQESLLALEQALEETGWSVHRDINGDLILAPGAPPASTVNGVTAADQWPHLAEKLRSAGWQVDNETDGSLRLVPPATNQKTEVAGPVQATESSATSSDQSDKSMQQKLRDTGWNVSQARDGSLLLYPPESKGAKPLPCPGNLTSVHVPLPVDNWHEAYDIAWTWLSVQQPFSAAVGKIRKIFDVHLVSIVSSSPPHQLIQQIAIRNSDGAVIVLN